MPSRRRTGARFTVPGAAPFVRIDKAVQIALLRSAGTGGGIPVAALLVCVNEAIQCTAYSRLLTSALVPAVCTVLVRVC